MSTLFTPNVHMHATMDAPETVKEHLKHQNQASNSTFPSSSMIPNHN